MYIYKYIYINVYMHRQRRDGTSESWTMGMRRPVIGWIRNLPWNFLYLKYRCSTFSTCRIT